MKQSGLATRHEHLIAAGCLLPAFWLLAYTGRLRSPKGACKHQPPAFVVTNTWSRFRPFLGCVRQMLLCSNGACSLASLRIRVRMRKQILTIYIHTYEYAYAKWKNIMQMDKHRQRHVQIHAHDLYMYGHLHNHAMFAYLYKHIYMYIYATPQRSTKLALGVPSKQPCREVNLH